MAIFSDASFRQAIDDEDLLIRPFEWNSLKSYHYELHLGADLFRQDPVIAIHDLLNPNPGGNWKQYKLGTDHRLSEEPAEIPSGEMMGPEGRGPKKSKKISAKVAAASDSVSNEIVQTGDRSVSAEPGKVIIPPGDVVLMSTREHIFYQDPLILRITTHPSLVIHNLEITGIPIINRLTKCPLLIRNLSKSAIVLTTGMIIASMTTEVAFEDPLRSNTDIKLDFQPLKVLDREWRSQYLLSNLVPNNKSGERHINDVLREMELETSEEISQYKDDIFDFDAINEHVEGALCRQWEIDVSSKKSGKKGGKISTRELAKASVKNSGSGVGTKEGIPGKTGAEGGSKKPKTGAQRRKEKRANVALLGNVPMK